MLKDTTPYNIATAIVRNQNGYTQETLTLLDVKKQLEELVEIQCRQGTWNIDHYMHGLANGLILALSLFNGVDEPVQLFTLEQYNTTKIEKN